MGHIRLGKIPKSQPWRAVVATVIGAAPASSEGERADERAGTSGGAPGNVVLDEKLVATAAARTLQAAQGALRHAIGDDGLRYTFYLLTQVALASRASDWETRLAAIGVHLPPDANVFQLTGAFQNAIDVRLSLAATGSDVSEVAQKAAGEALCQLAGARAETLFGNTGDHLRLALRQLSTKEGFGELGHAFFGRFLSHYLNFYLSRITASELGAGPLQSLGSISQFNIVLRTHCDQSARIVRDFTGEWYSKTEHENGITLENAGGFVAVAIKKLQAELLSQRDDL